MQLQARCQCLRSQTGINNQEPIPWQNSILVNDDAIDIGTYFTGCLLKNSKASQPYGSFN
jgi:hypothetical protein